MSAGGRRSRGRRSERKEISSDSSLSAELDPGLHLRTLEIMM